MKNSKIIRALMLITQLGISMMVPIFLCVFVGNFIDKKAGTGFFMPVLLILGIAAAFRNVYYLLRPFYAKDKEREDRELAYIERLKEEGRQQALKRKDAKLYAPEGSQTSGCVAKNPADTQTGKK